MREQLPNAERISLDVVIGVLWIWPHDWRKRGNSSLSPHQPCLQTLFALLRTIYLCKELGEGGDDLIPIVICKEVDSYVIWSQKYSTLLNALINCFLSLCLFLKGKWNKNNHLPETLGRPKQDACNYHCYFPRLQCCSTLVFRIQSCISHPLSEASPHKEGQFFIFVSMGIHERWHLCMPQHNIHFYSSIIAFWCCVSFWLYHKVSQLYVYFIPSLLNFPPTTPHPAPLGHHRALSWAPCAIQDLPTSYLFCTW